MRVSSSLVCFCFCFCLRRSDGTWLTTADAVRTELNVGAGAISVHPDDVADIGGELFVQSLSPNRKLGGHDVLFRVQAGSAARGVAGGIATSPAPVPAPAPAPKAKAKAKAKTSKTKAKAKVSTAKASKRKAAALAPAPAPAPAPAVAPAPAPAPKKPKAKTELQKAKDRAAAAGYKRTLVQLAKSGRSRCKSCGCKVRGDSNCLSAATLYVLGRTAQ